MLFVEFNIHLDEPENLKRMAKEKPGGPLTPKVMGKGREESQSSSLPGSKGHFLHSKVARED